jgi:hypothetical protein
MAISFVGATQATGTSVTLPDHEAGDIIIIAAQRDSSITPPTIPGTYAPIASESDDGLVADVAVAVGYLLASSDSEVSGTWTNASRLAVSIYRPSAGSAIEIGDVVAAPGVGSSMTIPALTLQDAGGTSWVVAIAAYSAGDDDIDTFTGLTNRVQAPPFPTRMSIFDTNAGVSSWSAVNDTGYSSSNGSVGVAIELKEVASGPTLTDVSPSTFTDGDTGIVATGSWSASGNTVELGDDPDYGSANLQAQTITAEDDEEITFTADLGSLTPGSLYVFVTDADGNTSEGFPVTVSALPPPTTSHLLGMMGVGT